jgi:purine nucleosidase/ribosylpyrimidine nucleosidase
LRVVARGATPAGIAAAGVIERRIDGHNSGQPMHIPDSAPVHDPLCVAFLAILVW